MKQFNLAEYLENPNKKIITKDGKSVRILCANREGWEKKIGNNIRDGNEKTVNS